MYKLKSNTMEEIIGKYKVKIVQDENPESPRTSMDNLGTMVCFHSRYNLGDKHNYDHGDYNGWDEMKLDIIKNEKVGVILPLYLFDHSGLSISTGDFNDRWDSGQIGFIFVSKDKMLKEYGGKICTKQLKEKVTKYLEGEVETYDQYLRGDIYGYKVWRLGKKSGKKKELIDSCWGFYGEDQCLDEARACVPEQKLPELVTE